MKKILLGFVSILCLVFSAVSAQVTFTELLTSYFNAVGRDIPSSSQYIKLNFTTISPGDSLYPALQKAVYLGLLPNIAVNPFSNQGVNEDLLAMLIKKHFGKEILSRPGNPLTKEKLEQELSQLPSYLHKKYGEEGTITIIPGFNYEITNKQAFPILNDIFLKLKNEHYDSKTIEENALLQGAMKGIAEATKDPHTVYFPPAEAKDFQDSLNGDFDGIGAYLEMKKPGVLIINAPILGSPAEKAGLRAGDIIIKIDSLVVDENMTLTKATSLIKGPAGTSVTLTIKRGDQTIPISITRAKITISALTGVFLDNGDFYIQISTFSFGASRDFENALTLLKKNPGNQDIILDLRNNPGGSLDEAERILDFFVPKGEPSVIISSPHREEKIFSQGSDFMLNTRKISILINGGSASASEILAGTIKEYTPQSLIIGEKSYGKGSVQLLVDYFDGSSIKYTTSKWKTGKGVKNIDGIGIKPDIEIINGTGSVGDLQLDYAKKR